MSTKNKQTAVDFLLHEISEIVGIIAPDAFSAGLMKIKYDQAKAMEKEQMIDFANDLIAQNDTNYIAVPDKAEEYYKQIYENRED